MMQRLTKRLASGVADYNLPGNGKSDEVEKSVFRQTCVERLAAYEDTGCEPEQIVKAKDALEYAYGNADRIIELAEADRDGRVVVLPCKVGDTVYLIVTKRARTYTPEFRFVKKSRLTFLNMERVLQDFGKAVFLTREEAEKALEAMKDE